MRLAQHFPPWAASSDSRVHKAIFDIRSRPGSRPVLNLPWTYSSTNPFRPHILGLNVGGYPPGGKHGAFSCILPTTMDPQPQATTLIQILRDALQQVEADSASCPDDRAALELKSSISLGIARLEAGELESDDLRAA